MRFKNYLAYFINLILSAIQLLLGLRLIFKLFALNSESSFIVWVYAKSNLALNIFGSFSFSIKFGSESSLELSTIIIMFIYALIGLGLTKLLTKSIKTNIDK